MFEIESAIREWRKQLPGLIPPATQQELESHLRDEIERLRCSGMEAEPAFLLARSKLGDPGRLSTEFAKLANGPDWLPVRWVRWLSLVLFLAALVVFCIFLYKDKGLLLAFHVASVTAGFVLTFLVGGLGACFLLARPFRILRTAQAASLRSTTKWMSAVAASCTSVAILCGMVWAAEEWGLAWRWDAKEIGALGIFGWSFLLAMLSKSQRVPLRLLMLLAVVGNSVTALGWFGANLIYTDVYPPASPSHLLIWFLVTQAICLAVGLLPEDRLPRNSSYRRQ